MRDGLSIRLKKAENFQQWLEVYLFDTLNGKIFPVRTIEVQTDPEGTQIEPVAQISSERAQDLLDDLWEAGFRPKNATNNIGVIAAKDAHIGHLAKFLEMALSK